MRRLFGLVPYAMSSGANGAIHVHVAPSIWCGYASPDVAPTCGTGYVGNGHETCAVAHPFKRAAPDPA
jgi:hypothetical protein